MKLVILSWVVVFVTRLCEQSWIFCFHKNRKFNSTKPCLFSERKATTRQAGIHVVIMDRVASLAKTNSPWLFVNEVGLCPTSSLRTKWSNPRRLCHCIVLDRFASSRRRITTKPVLSSWLSLPLPAPLEADCQRQSWSLTRVSLPQSPFSYLLRYLFRHKRYK